MHVPVFLPMLTNPSDGGNQHTGAATGGIYKDAVFDTNENPGHRHPEAGNIKKSRAFTVLPVPPAEL